MRDGTSSTSYLMIFIIIRIPNPNPDSNSNTGFTFILEHIGEGTQRVFRGRDVAEAEIIPGGEANDNTKTSQKVK